MGSYHKKCVKFSTWKSNIDFHFHLVHLADPDCLFKSLMGTH